VSYPDWINLFERSLLTPKNPSSVDENPNKKEAAMKRSILTLTVIFILAFTLASPVMAETVFRWARQGDAVTFAPHSANMSPTFLQLQHVYEPLVSYDCKIDKEPYLAESWRLVDPTTWEFKLRRGVTFHDGTPFTAEDVIFSINRAKGPGSDVKEPLKTVKDMTIIDDYTVRVLTNGPNPLLPAFLTPFFIVSKKWFEKHGVTQATSWEGKEEFYAVRHVLSCFNYAIPTSSPFW